MTFKECIIALLELDIYFDAKIYLNVSTIDVNGNPYIITRHDRINGIYINYDIEEVKEIITKDFFNSAINMISDGSNDYSLLERFFIIPDEDTEDSNVIYINQVLMRDLIIDYIDNYKESENKEIIYHTDKLYLGKYDLENVNKYILSILRDTVDSTYNIGDFITNVIGAINMYPGDYIPLRFIDNSGNENYFKIQLHNIFTPNGITIFDYNNAGIDVLNIRIPAYVFSEITEVIDTTTDTKLVAYLSSSDTLNPTVKYITYIDNGIIFKDKLSISTDDICFANIRPLNL